MEQLGFSLKTGKTPAGDTTFELECDDLAAGCDPDFLWLNCQVRFPFVFNATDVIMCMLVACP